MILKVTCEIYEGKNVNKKDRTILLRMINLLKRYSEIKESHQTLLFRGILHTCSLVLFGYLYCHLHCHQVVCIYIYIYMHCRSDVWDQFFFNVF